MRTVNCEWGARNEKQAMFSLKGAFKHRETFRKHDKCTPQENRISLLKMNTNNYNSCWATWASGCIKGGNAFI